MRPSLKYLFLFVALFFIHNCAYFVYKKDIEHTYHLNQSSLNIEDLMKRAKHVGRQLEITHIMMNTSLHSLLPNVIIQYGFGGTATTLQFQILCVLTAILHESEINFVGCYFGQKPAHKYTVLKTHELRNSVLQSLQSNAWVFMTSSSSLSSEKKIELEFNKRMLEDMNIRIPYVADIDTVSKRGHFIVYEYQHIFGVSDKTIQQVLEYVRYWDILRLCCGKQMSADWRNYLSPRLRYEPHHEQHSSTYPACEMYNISIVETLLIKTYIFQRFAHITSVHDVIGKPSNVDGDIDGNYCARCNKNISMKHLGFNEDCV